MFDVNLCKLEGGGMSDHFLVEARLKAVCRLRSAERMKGARNVLNVSEQNKSVKERAFQKSIRGKYKVLKSRMSRVLRRGGKCSEIL